MPQKFDETLAENLMGVALLVAIVLLALGIWAVVKAVELVVRQLLAHPDNRPLRIALGAALLLSLPAVLLGGRFPIFLLLWWLSLLALVITARVVQLYDDPQVQLEPPGRDALVDQVLHQPWWGAELTSAQQLDVA